MLRLAILLLLAATAAQAGLWPRGKGKVFFSAHANVEYIDEFGLFNQFGTVYGEYGLTEKLTLGIDYSGSELQTDKAVVFARYPIGKQDGTYLYAIELAAGLVDGNTALRPGFTVGRGITWGKRNGWMTLDTRAVLPSGDGDTRVETDFTFGLSLTPRVRGILQLQAGFQSGGDDYVKFAPSIVIAQKDRARRGKKRKREVKRFIEVGVTTGLMNYENHAVKIGIWREF